MPVLMPDYIEGIKWNKNGMAGQIMSGASYRRAKQRYLKNNEGIRLKRGRGLAGAVR